MLNLSSVFDYSVMEHPQKTAVIFGDRHLSYAQMGAAINQVANGLSAMGIGRGDKVALSCPNLPYFPMVYYGILKTGAVIVPLNLLLKGREIAYHLQDSEAKAYFCFQGTSELPMAQEGFKGFQVSDSCEYFSVITADPSAASPIKGTHTLGQLMADRSPVYEMVQTNPDDTAVILYTSGTTGFPKGAELSHSNMVMNARACCSLLGLTLDDVHVVVLPLFHSFGQTVQMNAGFSMGNTLIFIPRFVPEAVLSAVQNEKATVFCGVPTMYWAILDYEDKDKRYDIEKIAKTLRIGVSGGASLPLEIIKGFEEKYKIPIIEGYGLSETSPVVAFNHLHKERKPGSIGTPIWGIEVKIFDENNRELLEEEVGELVVRGHCVMKKYYNKPEETAEAYKGTSWFHTGDLGKKDEDGYLYIVDRVKDMLIRGGFNVYPREVEEVLMTHPAVSLAAVIGVPHQQYGEEVKAYIVLKEGQKITESEIIRWSKEQMASYKYPRIVEIRDSLPMTATGKILKKELKAEME
ncbi:MAG: long-chain fatty acid--CoA ligase [Candidatus Aminicenantes bacterium]|nr:long-chain fatty acid--CoA ligase [Candidatus Aminicenantes bacterium]